MEKGARARMARAFMDSLIKEREKERLRMMERDQGQRLRVIAISAGSLVIRKMTVVRRKVVESLVERRASDRLKRFLQQMVAHLLVVEQQWSSQNDQLCACRRLP